MAFIDNMQRWDTAHLRRADWPVMSAQVTPLVKSVCLNLVMRFPPVQRATAGGAHPALYIFAALLLDTIFPLDPTLPPTLPLFASPARPRAHTYRLTHGRPKTDTFRCRLQCETMMTDVLLSAGRE